MNMKKKINKNMIKRKLWIFLISIMAFWVAPIIFGVSNVFAYRPFISTDADVAEKDELEIEFGLLNSNNVKGIDEITAPSLVMNYGLSKKWEIVGEFDVQVYKEGEERNFELKEPALFLKGVVYEGILQGRERPGFAVEFGVLFPSTVKGEKNAGFESIGIVSGKISNLVYHLNFGGELDREKFDLNGIWGIILEYPFEEKFRLVGEVNGILERHGFSENSGLIGFIGEIWGKNLDFGIRKGLSDNTSVWELTTGVTFSF